MDQQIVNALVKVVQLKDESTVAHTWRVALYAKTMAEAVGLEHAVVDRIVQGAVLHDIGKIDIPYEILAKPGRLTDDEFDVIRTHTVLGYDRMIRMGETDDLILSLIRSHHERIDGTGYPDRLTGGAIPRGARHFAVIDTFDALTSIRPYRRQTGPEAAHRAIEELQNHAGIWYGEEEVQAFTTLFDSGDLDWILEYYNDQHSMDELRLEFAPPSSTIRDVHATRAQPDSINPQDADG
jgi:putative nucleotidyltransferase with HDIG domain